MQAKDFIKLGKQLLPQLPGFVIDKRVIFKSPVDDFLRGVYFESSADADNFYLSVFFLPLFVPTDAVHGNFSTRIGSAANWKAGNPNLMADLAAAIQDEAIPFLDNVATAVGALDYMQQRIESMRPRVNSHTLEASAYTLIKTGNFSSALDSLTELSQMLERDTIPWVVEQRKRAELMEEKLVKSPETALAQLDEWKRETVACLKLEKHCC